MVPNVESETNVNQMKLQKSKKRPQKTTSVLEINSASKKERHYKSDDVKLYMQKQKERRKVLIKKDIGVIESLGLCIMGSLRMVK